jgi:quercetin dioxygenase-like cupin family protein
MNRLKIDVMGTSTRYECEDMYAGLPAHAHKPNSGLEHNIHCIKGEILVYVLPETYKILKAGDIYEFDSTQWHGIVPIEEGAVFVNTSTTLQEDFHSVLDSAHNAPDWVLRIRDSIKRE